MPTLVLDEPKQPKLVLDTPPKSYGPGEDTWDYVLSKGGRITDTMPFPERARYEKFVENVQDRKGFEDKLTSTLYMASLTQEDPLQVWDIDSQLSRYIFNKKQMSPGEIVSAAIKNEKTITRFSQAWNRMIAETDEMPSFYEDMINQAASGLANVGSAGAQMMAELSTRPIGSPFGPAPAVTKADREFANEMKANARLMWDISKDPELVLKRDDIASKVLGMGMQTIPYITGTTAATLIAGPLGGFAVGWMVEGNSAYQTAIDEGLSEEDAKAIGMGVGMIAGAIETTGMLGADKLFEAATAKIKNKIIRGGVSLTVGSITEALEEASQELTAIAGESLYKDVDFEDAVKRTLASAAGGAAVGGMFKTVSAAARGVTSGNALQLTSEQKRALRLAAAQETLRAETVAELEKNIDESLKAQEEAKKAAEESQKVAARRVVGGMEQYTPESVEARKKWQEEQMRTGNVIDMTKAPPLVPIESTEQPTPAGTPAEAAAKLAPQGEALAPQGEKTEKAKLEEQAQKLEKEPKPLNAEKDIDEDEMPSVTSARQAMIADDRKALGLDEMASTERKGWQKSLSNANKKGIPDRAMRIAQEVNETPRALDDEETAGLVVRAARLKNEYKNLMTEINKADDAGMKSLSAEAERIEAEFEILSRAIHLSGTEKGRALVAQKLTINQDYNLISVKSRAKAAKGKALTVDESQRLTEATNQLEQANTKIVELERQINEMSAKRAIKERGIKRYSKMSLEQKDVELNQDIKRLNELIEAGCF